MRRSRRAGFTVASLLLLTAVVATYAGAIMSLRNMDPPPEIETLVAYGVIGFFFGAISLSLVAVISGGKNRQMIAGALEGAFFGPPTALLLAIPESVPVLFVGAVILVGFAFAVRTLSSARAPHLRDKEQTPAE